MVTTPDVLSKGKSGTRNLVKSSNSGIDMVQDATVWISTTVYVSTYYYVILKFCKSQKDLERKYSIFQTTYVRMER